MLNIDRIFKQGRLLRAITGLNRKTGSFLLLVILRQDQDVPFPTLKRS